MYKKTLNEHTINKKRFFSMPKTYKVIFYAADEGGYYAECPSLSGCYTQGETLEELRKNMLEAFELYLEDEISDEDTVNIEVCYA